MGSERSTEMDSGILYFTTILDDMWRGFKKFFLLCFLSHFSDHSLPFLKYKMM